MPVRLHTAAILALTTLLLCGSAWAQATNGTSSGQKEVVDEITERRRADGESARLFCASPGFKKLSCGLASVEEERETIKKQCPGCGTLYFGLRENWNASDPERQYLYGVDRYGQIGIGIVSLACRGPIVVRSVFKMIKEPEDALGPDCTNAMLVYVYGEDVPISKGGNASPKLRCELQLPATGGSELERAQKAKEIPDRCWLCSTCEAGKGCPSRKGVWYSDTFTTVATGCNIDPKKGYMVHRVGIGINPYTKILLAKFEVCGSGQSCFNPQLEQAKLKSAKPCVNGTCLLW